MATHKSCTLIAKYEEVAEKNSAAYRQGKIDAEIEAAKEVVDRLAAQKDIIIQKRFESKYLFCLQNIPHTYIYNTLENTPKHIIEKNV